MTTLRLVPFLAAALAFAMACDDGPSPEQKANAAIREKIQQTISELEAKSRTKAASLGMATAQTADITEVKSFVCSALVKNLKGMTDSAGRSAVSDDLTEYDCRNHADWLDVLRATAKRQGMAKAGEATVDDARSFVCRRIRESLDAVKGEAKESLKLEAKLYDCFL
jgi:hypothetical protein